MKNTISRMLFLSSIFVVFLSLSGCVAVPADGYYYSSGYYNNGYSTNYSNGSYYYNNNYDNGYYQTVPAYTVWPTILLEQGWNHDNRNWGHDHDHHWDNNNHWKYNSNNHEHNN